MDYGCNNFETKFSYTFSSASGFLYFSLNFGEEVSSSTQISIQRSSILQGFRQLVIGIVFFFNYIATIWYWSSPLGSKAPFSVSIVSFLLCIICSFCTYFLHFGLPDCYSSSSPSIPYFWRSLMNRNLTKWFLLSESLSAFWLGNFYGRTWRFLWIQPLSPWIIFILVFFFFVIVWGLLLYLFQYWSKTHSWIMCIFAVGLISPKWAQVFWSTSFM